MKTILTLALFLLLTILAEAQSLSSGLTKTVETINSMLHPNKMVRFINQGYNTFYPTKINANMQGDVFCIESSTRFSAKSSGIIFNLLKVKVFVINKNEIKALDQDQQTIVTILQGNSNDALSLKKELDALRFICNTNSKLDPKFKCD